MTEEEFLKLRKEKMTETIDSIVIFSEHIINSVNQGYSSSELELAHHLRLAVIFYRAREDATERVKRANEMGLLSERECNILVQKELEKLNEKED